MCIRDRKPADGRPVTMPTQDMVIGHYFLTLERKGLVGEGRVFSSVAEAYMAFDRNELAIGSPCRVRVSGIIPPEGQELRPDGSILLELSLIHI